MTDGTVRIGVEADGSAFQRYLETVDQTAAASLEGLRKESAQLETELAQVEKALQFNPKSSILLAQKQELAAKAAANTRQQLALMTSAQTSLNQALQNQPEFERAYAEASREIEKATEKLGELKKRKQEADKVFSNAGVTANQYERLEPQIARAEQALQRLQREKERADQAMESPASSHYQKLQADIEKAAEKLEQLKAKKLQADRAMEEGGASLESYRALQREISASSDALEELQRSREAVNQQFEAGHLDAGEFRAVQREIETTSQTLRQLETQSGQTQAAMDRIGQTAGDVGKKLLPVSLAVAGLGAAAVKAGMDFDAGMSQVAAVSGASGKELEALRSKAKEMGETTKFSASESAEALNFMAMAGWKTNDMLDGLQGVMDLAAASGEELGTVSDIVTDAMTAFGLSAEDSGHFSDVLAQASSNANTNVGLMGATFKYVAPVAGAMGYTIEDTALAVGLMANAGIKGEQAGTALRAMFSRLVKPPREAAKAMEALNLSAVRSDGSMKSLSEVLESLRESFRGLSQSEQASYASALAGQEAMSGMLAIINASDQDYQKLSMSIAQADGAAQNMADTMQDNLAGDITLLKSQLEGIGIQLSEIMVPVLRNAADGVSGLLEKFSQLPQGAQELVVMLMGVTAAAGPAAKGIEGIAAAMKKVEKFFSDHPALLAVSVVMAAVAAVVKLVDILDVTAQEQAKIADQAVQAYKDSISSLEGINKELQTTEDRMNELRSKGPLTLVEQAELEKLRAVTEELNLQFSLEEKKAREAAQKAAKEIQKWYEKSYQVDSQDEGIVGKARFSNDVKVLIAGYKQATQRLNQAIKDGNEEGRQLMEESLEDIKIGIHENYLPALEELNRQKMQMLSLEPEVVKEYQWLIDQMTQMRDTFMSIEMPNELKQIKFTEILDIQEIQEAKASLMDLAGQGKLTADALNAPEYEELRKQLEAAGISADQAVVEIKALAQANQDAAGKTAPLSASLEDVSGEALELTESLSSLSSEYSLVKKAQDETSQSGRLSADTLQSILEKYPGLSEAVKDYHSGLVTEQELLAQVSKAYETDLENHQLLVLSKLVHNEAFYEAISGADGELVQTMSKNYGADLSNCKTYAEAKAKLEQDLLNAVSKSWAEYYNAQTGQMTDKYKKIMESLPHDDPAYLEAQKVAGALERGKQAAKELEKLASSQIDVKFEEAAGKAKNAGASLQGTGEKSGRDYSKALAQGIRREKAGVDRSVEEIAKAASQAALEGAEDFQSVGSLYISSFEQGLEAKVQESQEEVGAFVEAQVGALSQSNQGAAEEFQKAGKLVTDAYAQAISQNADQAVKAVSQKMKAITDEAQAQYNSLIQQRDSLASRLADFGDLFTITEKESQGNGSAEKYWEVQKANLEQQMKDIQSYYDRLEELRDRGASQEILNEIMGMDKDQGMAAMDSLLSESQEGFQRFVAQFDQVQSMAKERAAQFYEGEIQQLKTGFTDQISQAMASVPDLVKEVGINTTAGFVEGVASRLEDVSGQGRQVADSVLSALRGALDCHSPSKETEVIGEYAAEGLIKGMEVQRGAVDSSARSIGSQLVSGLWTGIAGEEGWLMAEIQAFCYRVISSFRSSFSIHSPSRVMRDLIGKNLVAGIEVGIEEETPGLLQTTEKEMARVTQRMQEAAQAQNASFDAPFAGRLAFPQVQAPQGKGDVTLTINNNCPKTISRADQRRNLLQMSASWPGCSPAERRKFVSG